MEKITENVTDKLTTKLLGYLDNTEIFLKEEVPDYLDQVLQWMFWESVLASILGLGLLVASYFLMRAANNECKKSDQNEGIIIGGFVGGVFALLFGIMLFACNITTVVKVKVAPKVVLVDYLRK